MLFSLGTSEFVINYVTVTLDDVLNIECGIGESQTYLLILSNQGFPDFSLGLMRPLALFFCATV